MTKARLQPRSDSHPRIGCSTAVASEKVIATVAARAIESPSLSMIRGNSGGTNPA